MKAHKKQKVINNLRILIANKADVIRQATEFCEKHKLAISGEGDHEALFNVSTTINVVGLDCMCIWPNKMRLEVGACNNFNLENLGGDFLNNFNMKFGQCTEYPVEGLYVGLSNARSYDEEKRHFTIWLNPNRWVYVEALLEELENESNS